MSNEQGRAMQERVMTEQQIAEMEDYVRRSRRMCQYGGVAEPFWVGHIDALIASHRAQAERIKRLEGERLALARTLDNMEPITFEEHADAVALARRVIAGTAGDGHGVH
jgi:hypothetical protein